MNTVDFPMLLKFLTDNAVGDRYSGLYLAIGFLSGALDDDEARADLIAYGAEHPHQLQRLLNLSDKLQAVIAKADNANS